MIVFLSLRTSDRCHWCGNPLRFFESVSGGFPSDRGIPTKVVRYFLGMTVLLFVLFSFSETAPLGGDKRDRTAEALNAMAHVVQKSIDKPHISLKNKKYWNYCTQLLDENPIIPMPDILIQV